MMQHIRIIHLGERKHVCQYCGRRFGKLYHKKVHEKRHLPPEQDMQLNEVFADSENMDSVEQATSMLGGPQ